MKIYLNSYEVDCPCPCGLKITMSSSDVLEAQPRLTVQLQALIDHKVYYASHASSCREELAYYIWHDHLDSRETSKGVTIVDVRTADKDKAEDVKEGFKGKEYSIKPVNGKMPMLTHISLRQSKEIQDYDMLARNIERMYSSFYVLLFGDDEYKEYRAMVKPATYLLAAKDFSFYMPSRYIKHPELCFLFYGIVRGVYLLSQDPEWATHLDNLVTDKVSKSAIGGDEEAARIVARKYAEFFGKAFQSERSPINAKNVQNVLKWLDQDDMTTPYGDLMYTWESRDNPWRKIDGFSDVARSGFSDRMAKRVFQ